MWAVGNRKQHSKASGSSNQKRFAVVIHVMNVKSRDIPVTRYQKLEVSGSTVLCAMQGVHD